MNMRAAWSILMLVALIGCSSNENGSQWDQERTEMRTRIEANLEEIDNEMAELQNEIADADEAAREDLQDEKAELEEARRDLSNALDQLADQTEDTWNDWSASIESTLEDIAAETRSAGEAAY